MSEAEGYTEYRVVTERGGERAERPWRRDQASTLEDAEEIAHAYQKVVIESRQIGPVVPVEVVKGGSPASGLRIAAERAARRAAEADLERELEAEARRIHPEGSGGTEQ